MTRSPALVDCVQMCAKHRSGHCGRGLGTGGRCTTSLSAQVPVEVGQSDPRGHRAESGAEDGEVRRVRSRGTTDPPGVNRTQGGYGDRGACVGLLCPNPSANPVGVHRQRGDRPLVLHGRKRLVTALLATRCHRPRRPRPRDPDLRRARTSTMSRPAWTRLYHQAEEAQERYNDAKLELARPRGRPRLPSGRPGAPAAGSTRRPARSPEPWSASTRARASPPPARSSLSEDPGAFLGQLTTLSRLQRPSRPRLSRTSPPRSRRCRSRRQAGRQARAPPRSRRPRRRWPSEKATVDAKLAEAKELLGRARGRGARRLWPRPAAAPARASDVPASGRAAAAAGNYALAQVGDAYVYGAAGPERLRLLRPDDDGLGAGRRRPAALLGRADGLGPAGRPPAPAARRPGLLLQPDQPRRHLHRQRPDRARRQPGHRRAVAGVYSMPYSGAVRPG